MARTVVIGDWVVKEKKQVTHCPSYYAADTETLELQPGRYPVRLSFEDGYTIPMPYWLLIGVDAVRVSGRLFSGFGGHNFAFTELPVGEAKRYHIQLYDYALPALVASGQIELHPGCEWALETRAAIRDGVNLIERHALKLA